MPSFQSVEPQINNKNQDLKSAVTTIEKYDSCDMKETEKKIKHRYSKSKRIICLKQKNIVHCNNDINCDNQQQGSVNKCQESQNSSETNEDIISSNPSSRKLLELLVDNKEEDEYKITIENPSNKLINLTLLNNKTLEDCHYQPLVVPSLFQKHRSEYSNKINASSLLVSDDISFLSKSWKSKDEMNDSEIFKLSNGTLRGFEIL